MINHLKKFIYIHIPKTGGSSVEYALLNTFHKTLKQRFDSYTGPNIYDFMSPLEKEYVFGSSIQECQHSVLSEFDDTLQKEYFCFAFVRNPWDYMVSEWTYLKRHGLSWSFEKLLLTENFKISDYHLRPQLEFLNTNINYIGRFENISEDFSHICNEIGARGLHLPHHNKTSRGHYSEYYNEATKEIVAKKYAKDIEYFGYTYEEK